MTQRLLHYHSVKIEDDHVNDEDKDNSSADEKTNFMIHTPSESMAGNEMSSPEAKNDDSNLYFQLERGEKQ